MTGDAERGRIEDFTVHITVDDAHRAAAWYVDALGAVEESRIELPGGKLIQLEMRFGPQKVVIADEFPDHQSFGPAALGGTYSALYLHVDDVDAVFDRAIAAGASVVRPPADMFWGDRDAQVIDPFGHRWGLARHVRDVAHADMVRLAAEAFG